MIEKRKEMIIFRNHRKKNQICSLCLAMETVTETIDNSQFVIICLSDSV